jgi:hypothetical protein
LLGVVAAKFMEVIIKDMGAVQGSFSEIPKENLE